MYEIHGVLRTGNLCQVFIFKYYNVDMEVTHLHLNMQTIILIVPVLCCLN